MHCERDAIISLKQDTASRYLDRERLSNSGRERVTGLPLLLFPPARSAEVGSYFGQAVKVLGRELHWQIEMPDRRQL